MSSNFNMSFDPAVRQQFANVLAEYGLTVPQAFKLFANQVVKTGVVPLSFDWAGNRAHILSPSGERMLNESIADIEQGRYSTHTAEEMVNDLAEIARG